MSLKAELEQWHQAVEYYDDQNYGAALEIFESIADSAKIHFNIGLILGRQGNHKEAALGLDRYLVVALFQRGVARMVQQQNHEALQDFNEALKYLRDNDCIDYSQIGLDYKVYLCEVLYNRALCYFCLGEEMNAMKDLELAAKPSIPMAWTVPLYCVPRGVIYRPSASKLKSSKKIDFLGSAKVIASADGKDNFTGFKGALVRKETMRTIPLKSSGRGQGNMAHQKSMRVKKSTPPPEALGSLARSNTMPAHRVNGNAITSDASTPTFGTYPKSAAPVPQSRTPDEAMSLPPQMTKTKSEMSMNSDYRQARLQALAQAQAQRTQPHSADPYRIEGEESPSASDYSDASRPPASAPALTPEPDTRREMPQRSPGPSPSPGATQQRGTDPLEIIRAGLARRTTFEKPAEPAGAAQRRTAARDGAGSPALDRIDETSPMSAPLQRGPGAQLPAPVARQPPNTAAYGSEMDHDDINSMAQGVAGMQVQNAELPYAQAHALPQSVASSVSPGPMPTTAGPQYMERMQHTRSPSSTASSAPPHNVSFDLHSNSATPASTGSGGSGLRRAPTKRGSMKIKFHFANDTFNLMVPTRITFDGLVTKLTDKIAMVLAQYGQQQTVSPNAGLKIRYLDEDGEAVLMTDEDDFELAKAYAGGDMSAPETNIVERLELWCSL
ncbi:hypothetical protein DL89DRAFT_320464 [Linderina pennispora]|uniref:PB1 domain-containing protein n=1 Tax=Linderina pennispora TaxID=61395 RepID=A0A1Y1WGI6_9FUNG|nr:uncharacterized protein DL89DRAFT_320464 [Linderina pennispora]ORX72661.1 hypothetical protein DL89DRAFT_320464 [Linderina pennispora]